MDSFEWDVFISHASEDKDDIARPLAKRLRDFGLRVWFDEDVLEIGDSLFRSINLGLAKSRYGIVILSPKFFAKEWTKRELSGLFQLAVSENKSILPVWHNTSLREIVGQYPMLTDLVAVSSAAGIEQVVEKLIRVIKKAPDLDVHSRLEIYRGFMLGGLIKEIIHDDSALYDVILTLKKMEPEVDGIIHNTIRKDLQQLIVDRDHSVKERVRAGNALAMIGDLRFRSDAWCLPDDDLLGFVEIPAGEFLMGSDRSERIDFDNCESPQHRVYLPSFYIGRYPVTVSQYCVYLSATGNNPALRDLLEGIDNHPASSLTWLDALHYCHWLNGLLLNWSQTPVRLRELLKTDGDGAPWKVGLPSEAEWEKAARGSYDARIFPWGPQANPGQANFIQSELESTSPVGCFSMGASPYGIQDMSGNVWEWTRSNWGTNIETPKYWYPYSQEDGREDTQAAVEMLRIIRGGSFQNSAEDIRCSCRRADMANVRHEHIGFRLVITQSNLI